MKRFSIFLFLFFIIGTTVACAQEGDSIRTLFGKSGIHGGFGAASFRYTTIDNRDSYMNGIRGGWILNHSFVLGLGGYSFTSASEYDEQLEGDGQFTGGYGGLLFETVFFSGSIVHFSIPVIVGGGGIAYRKKFDDLQSIDEWGNVDNEPFFVVEPGIEVEVNVFRFMRAGVGAYYRYASDVELKYQDGNQQINALDNPLTGPSYGFTLKFGKF